MMDADLNASEIVDVSNHLESSSTENPSFADAVDRSNEHHKDNVELSDNTDTKNATDASSAENTGNDNQCVDGTEGPQKTDLYVYRQDVVRPANKNGLIGMIMEVAGDYDSDSDLDESEDDAQSTDSLQSGQVRVIWSDHTETRSDLKDIIVMDRAFMHGDIVASITDPTGQTGIIVDVDIKVDLLAANGDIIRGISSRDLERIREFAVGDYVLCGPWLGRVDEVFDNVNVMFDDGSVCKVIRADQLHLLPVSASLLEDAHFPYYPGQRVKASTSSVFKNARWLSGTWKVRHSEGTVVKVQVASVFVYWIASANPGYGSNSTGIPTEEQEPKNLKLLSCLSYANWQLGDRCLLASVEQVMEPKVDDVSLHRKRHDSFRNWTSDVKVSAESAAKLEISGENTSGSDMTSAVIPENDVFIYEDAFSQRDDEESGVDGHQSGSLESQKYVSDSDELKATNVDVNGECFDTRNHIDAIKSKNLENRKLLVDDNASDFGSCSSSFSFSKESAHDSRHNYRKILRKIVFRRDRRAKKKEEPFEKAYLIVNTQTKVDVVWQDASRWHGTDSRELLPINDNADHEFYPEQYVVEKASNEDEQVGDVKRVGIVRTVNAKERTACIRWLKPVSQPEDPREFDKEELVSVYELDEHPDYDYCYGDTVIRLPSAPIAVIHASSVSSNLGPTSGDSHDKADTVEPEPETTEMNQQISEPTILVSDNESDLLNLSWVGNITGLKDGDIEVTWADGMVSTVGPQGLFVVGRDEDDVSSEANIEDGDDSASWETLVSDDMNVDQKDEGIEGEMEQVTEDASERLEEDAVDSTEKSHVQNGGPFSALGFVARFAAGILFRGKKTRDSKSSEGTSEPAVDSFEKKEIELDKDIEDATEVSPNNADDVASNQDFDEQHPSSESMLNIVDTDCFKHFDSTKDPRDHNFLDENGQHSNERKWLRKVHQEWGILEKNLPDTIYVRVYEDRMDLMRAVIIGAYGTPYQDGLFFFDFYLPPEYPQVPPLVYYHSGGLRVNPNLYENGKVCLSLLNTWTGKGNEIWDQSSSSILQVLVSLQGLVLNSKPYFNEAGYDKQIGTAEGEKNSLSYNENSFLLSCKSMLYRLQRPPMHFEALVKSHFQRHGYYILKACDAYLRGAMVGSLNQDASLSEKSNLHEPSVGFKLMLTKIVPKLIAAFTEVGVDCNQFQHLAATS